MPGSTCLKWLGPDDANLIRSPSFHMGDRYQASRAMKHMVSVESTRAGYVPLSGVWVGYAKCRNMVGLGLAGLGWLGAGVGWGVVRAGGGEGGCNTPTPAPHTLHPHQHLAWQCHATCCANLGAG